MLVRQGDYYQEPSDPGGQMERTGFRVIEWAGLSIAVDSSEDLVWDWSDRGLEERACSGSEVDIHVGVSCGEIVPPHWDPITYSFDGGSFDVDLVDGQWWIAVHAQGRRFERLARFNRGLTEGEVVIAEGFERGLAHPLDGPVLDWLVTHAIMERGGLVLQGSAILESGTAFAMLNAQPGATDMGFQGSNWDGSVPVMTPGSRFAITPMGEGFRVDALEFDSADRGSSFQGELKAIHLVDQAAQAGMDILDVQTGMEAVLSCVCAPIHAPELADRILAAVARLVARVPVARDAQTETQSPAVFSWGSAQYQMGFAKPTEVSLDPAVYLN